MTTCEKVEFLAARRRFGMKPGLERMESLLAALGNPEREMACVHVAGTNGKGSVAACIAAVLAKAGFGSVGLYTSPHLVHFNERIRIDGEPVATEVLEPALDRVLAAVAALEAQGEYATFFECATALAFDVFKAQGIRLAVIETGLGGRLDATNVIVPVLSVITNVGLEHCEYLGDTVAKIAVEKAGIAKPGRPLVLGAMSDEASSAIRARAAAVGAPVADMDVSVGIRRRGSKGKGDAEQVVSIEDDVRSVSGIRFPLSGDYQRENLATATAALEVFSRATGLEISDAAFKEGLESVVWPCRFQRVSTDPDVVVDGAHNPPAAVALAKTLGQTFAKSKTPLALVVGFCGDKNAYDVLRALKPFVRVAFATETPTPRTSSAAATGALLRQAGLRDAAEFPDWREALEAARGWARENAGAVLVCGSLFLAGAVAESFGAMPWKGGIAVGGELLKPSAK